MEDKANKGWRQFVINRWVELVIPDSLNSGFFLFLGEIRSPKKNKTQTISGLGWNNSN